MCFCTLNATNLPACIAQTRRDRLSVANYLIIMNIQSSLSGKVNSSLFKIKILGICSLHIPTVPYNLACHHTKLIALTLLGNIVYSLPNQTNLHLPTIKYSKHHHSLPQSSVLIRNQSSSGEYLRHAVQLILQAERFYWHLHLKIIIFCNWLTGGRTHITYLVICHRMQLPSMVSKVITLLFAQMQFFVVNSSLIDWSLSYLIADKVMRSNTRDSLRQSVL